MANQPKQQPTKADQKADAAHPETSLYRAQARRTVAQAAQEELKLKRVQGILVEKAAVERAQFATYRRVRDGLLNIAARTSGLVAAEKNQAKCFVIINTEVRRILEELAKSQPSQPAPAKAPKKAPKKARR